MPTPAIRITDKPVSTPCEQTHFLVTQPELPEGYTPTGEETAEELAALKVESLREIDVNSLIRFFNRKPVEFTEALERENIASGENPSTLFGKIKKWFTDLKDGAFHSVANNYTTTAEGYVLDARLGPAIKSKMDLVDTLNSEKMTVDKITSNSFTVIGNDTQTLSFSVAKTGWTPVGIVALDRRTGTSQNNLLTYTYHITNNNLSIGVKNISSSAANVTVVATVLYVKA